MGTKRKYGQPTEMMAVRVPTQLHDALKDKAKRERRPKSETLIDVLSAALETDQSENAFE